jgi:hypothetical protein
MSHSSKVRPAAHVRYRVRYRPRVEFLESRFPLATSLPAWCQGLRD